MGGEGSGPGGFSDPVGLTLGPGGRPWVVDPGNGRYTVYDTAGEHAADYRRRVPGYSVPWPGRFTGDSVLYDLALRSDGGDGLRRVLFGFWPSGDPPARVDSIPIPESPFSQEQQQWEFRSDDRMMAFGIPWSPGLVWQLDAESHLWFGRSDRYRLLRRAPDGDTVRVVEREWEPVPVTAKDRERNGLLRMLRERNLRPDLSRLPDAKPAFRAIRTDPDGYLWVEASAAIGGPEGRPVDVFDPTGRYLGCLRLPFSLRRAAFGEDVLCGTATDEAGVPRVSCVALRGRPS